MAPFNSTRSHLSSLHSSVQELIEQKSIIIWFGPKVKEIDHQYELNNNGELDNGVYNKFVNNSIRNDEDGDKAGEEYISLDSHFSGDDPEELSEFSGGYDRRGQKEELYSNYNFVINEEIVRRMNQEFKYPLDYIIKCLDDNKANYCTASYYLLLQDQNF